MEAAAVLAGTVVISMEIPSSVALLVMMPESVLALASMWPEQAAQAAQAPLVAPAWEEELPQVKAQQVP
jgi:hypothetical protein